MLNRRWRKRAAYGVVLCASIASLATSYGQGREVVLEGTMVATKGGPSQRRFRVQTTAPWTTVTAEVTGVTQEKTTLSVALMADDALLFDTSNAERSVLLKADVRAQVAMTEPPCAIKAAGCSKGDQAGAAAYAFSLVFDGAATDATVRYRVTVSTDAIPGENDFGLELREE